MLSRLSLFAFLLILALPVLAAAPGDRIEVKAQRNETKKVGDQGWQSRLSGAQVKHHDVTLTADEMVILSNNEQTTITSSSAPQLKDAVATITGNAVTMTPRDTSAQFTGKAKMSVTARPADEKAVPAQWTFTADTIQYNYDTKGVRLTGHVTLIAQNGVISFGDQAVEYDAKTGQLAISKPAAG